MVVGLLKNLLAKLNRDKEDEAFAEYQESWNEVVYHRENLDIHDPTQRREYIQGCLEQIADAAREVEGLTIEYNTVTSYLTDMEEIEALPDPDHKSLEVAASKVSSLQEQRESFQGRKVHMTDAQFHQMERVEDEVEEGLAKLKEAEEYQSLVKRDLSRLDSERQAFRYRRHELVEAIEQSRVVAIVCTVMVVLSLILLLALQFGFQLDAGWGYVFTIAVSGLVYGLVYWKHQDATVELRKLEKDNNRLIQLQNTVKIRYVNNTNLLEYLRVKYKVESSKELQKLVDAFAEEKEARERYRRAKFDLDENEQELVRLLRRFRVKDPTVWLKQTDALLDHKEMVEIRHNLIIRRQALRKRIDYNRDVIVGNAKKEIKDIVDSYPRYATEIMAMVDKYL